MEQGWLQLHAPFLRSAYCSATGTETSKSMSTSFPPSIAELTEDFHEMPDWDERYEYLVELGRELPVLDAQFQTAENKVDGCMSTVWMVTHRAADNHDRIEIQADSDSLIVKGLIVVLLSLFSSKTAEQILHTDPEATFAELGLNQHLSPNRRNGLYSMVKRLKQLALADEATK